MGAMSDENGLDNHDGDTLCRTTVVRVNPMKMKRRRQPRSKQVDLIIE